TRAQRTCDSEAAGSAATAEALREQAVRVDTSSGDIAAALDRDVIGAAAARARTAEGKRAGRAHERQRACDGEAATAAFAADRERGRRALADSERHSEAAGAAATADALRVDRVRVVAVRDD